MSAIENEVNLYVKTNTTQYDALLFSLMGTTHQIWLMCKDFVKGVNPNNRVDDKEKEDYIQQGFEFIVAEIYDLIECVKNGVVPTQLIQLMDSSRKTKADPGYYVPKISVDRAHRRDIMKAVVPINEEFLTMIQTHGNKGMEVTGPLIMDFYKRHFLKYE
jgi:hypothetical protein